jgi:ssDNA-binding Zn-finger/Zn-ribbon topoisomerase 1
MIKVSQDVLARKCPQCGKEHNFRFVDTRSEKFVTSEICTDCFFYPYTKKGHELQEDIKEDNNV